jgi:hypothetical protein
VARDLLDKVDLLVITEIKKILSMMPEWHICKLYMLFFRGNIHLFKKCMYLEIETMILQNNSTTVCHYISLLWMSPPLNDASPLGSSTY